MQSVEFGSEREFDQNETWEFHGNIHKRVLSSACWGQAQISQHQSCPKAGSGCWSTAWCSQPWNWAGCVPSPSCPPRATTVPIQGCSLLQDWCWTRCQQHQQQEMLLQSFHCLYNDCTALQDKKVLSYPVQEPTSIPIVPSHSLY